MVEKSESSTPNLQLSKARGEQGLSQQEVADEIGTTPVSVSRWENGKTFPTPHYRQKLCKLYNKTPEELGLLPKDDESHAKSLSDPSQVKSGPFLAPPRPPYALVGRDDLLSSLKKRLFGGQNLTLSALNGLPGIGKTALAIALAHDREVLTHFSDGVLWAGLGPKADVKEHLVTWGMALGLLQDGLEKLVDIELLKHRIQAAIGLRRMLLVVDDAWSVETARDFLVGGHYCVYLVTTRLPQVASLFAGKGVITVQELGEDDGLSLLSRLAPEIVRAEPHGAKKLVRAVGGLPLALVLMGNYMRIHAQSRSPRRIRMALDQLYQIEKRLRLEQPSMAGDSLRHLQNRAPCSLQATIALSDQHLDEQARYTLYALSAFPAKPNTFSEAAALATCNTPAKTLDFLTDVGLLEGVGLLEERGLERYTLHQTIADYAQLKRTDTVIEERMVAFFVSFIKDHQTDYDILDMETSNIYAALQYAFEREILSALVAGANALAPFLEARGLNDIAQMHLERAQQAALSLGDDLSLARIRLHLGRIAEQRGNFLQAEEWYQKGLILARRIDHREITCDLLTNIGELAVDRGNLKQARQYVQEGLDLARELDDKQRICILLENLGEIVDNHELFEQKDTFEQGDEYYLEALVLARTINNSEMICTLLQDLGAKAFYREDDMQAEQYYQKGLDLARKIGYQQRISAFLTNMGMVAIKQRKFLEAQKYCRESLEIARRIQNRWRIGNALQNFGILYTARGKYKWGEKYLLESLDIARDMQYPYLIGETLCELGELYLKQHKIEKADIAFNEAFKLGEKIDNGWLFYFSLYGLARIKAIHNDISCALYLGQKSLKFYKAVDHYKKNEVESWLNTLPIER